MTGIEPATSLQNTTEKQQIPSRGGAPDGARPARMARNGQELPDDLAELVRAWPALPAALRAGIVAMVKASGAK